ncbi:hypothetical protein [Haloterrigena alkaliphila]|uniref:Uncharacterized protein n=1 Tax=Haloterrigena alkaliphila TaxID=2816475 RepID=A0A8A2VIL6_9EURY|nr:hypothetical protein [Haloterrigena alkaliphila]QSX00306.1 hypothetical protein J0X25_04900 [Haloterrigena alkaliphila]
MNDPRSPRRIPAIDDRSVLETALLAIGVTFLFVASTLLALLAASTVRDDPSATAVVVLLVGTATVTVGAVGARRFVRWLAPDRTCSHAGAWME